jgi:hypothetical protein
LAAQPVLTGFYSLPSRGVSARGGDDMPRTFYHFLLNSNLIISWFLRNGKKKPVNGNPAADFPRMKCFSLKGETLEIRNT